MPSELFEYKSTSLGNSLSAKGGNINLDEAQGIVECFVAGIGNKDSVGDIVASGGIYKEPSAPQAKGRMGTQLE